jgi:hypothetical protein
VIVGKVKAGRLPEHVGMDRDADARQLARQNVSSRIATIREKLGQ